MSGELCQLRNRQWVGVILCCFPYLKWITIVSSCFISVFWEIDLVQCFQLRSFPSLLLHPLVSSWHYAMVSASMVMSVLSFHSVWVHFVSWGCSHCTAQGIHTQLSSIQICVCSLGYTAASLGSLFQLEDSVPWRGCVVTRLHEQHECSHVPASVKLLASSSQKHFTLIMPPGIPRLVTRGQHHLLLHH